MDEKYMLRAIELAMKGEGSVNPNPLVGAVIVKNNKIIGEGYHKRYGDNHAEVNAFENAKEDVKGATMYVTLEPCSHYGKTPPCAKRVIEEGINKIIIGSNDPNPLVSGKGIEMMRKAGIEVVTEFLKEKCDEINEVFMKYIVDKKPYVLMKCAMFLDGKIATVTGDSKYISSEESRAEVHRLRNKYKGIMVGVNTIINDNPKLTCRLEGGRNPIPIVVDSNLRTPIDSYIVKNANELNTIIATISNDDDRKNEYINKGVNVIQVNSENNRVDLNDLMDKLGKLKIDGILLEGGAELNYSALESKIVDKVCMYIAPKIIGGKEAKTPVSGSGILSLKQAYCLKDMNIRKVGCDVVIEGKIGD